METNNPHNDLFEKNNSIPKQNNFKMPEGYFEGLAGRLEEELEIKNESSKKGILRVLAINVSIAAAVVLGVFLFNPDQKEELFNEVAKIEVGSEEVMVEDYMISMVDATEEWDPLEYYDIEVTTYSEEEIEAVEMPTVEEVTTDDITDFFEDEDYYEL
jgi:ribonucleotide reductase alpha subunit